MDVTYAEKKKKKKIISQVLTFKGRHYLWKIKILYPHYLTFLCSPWILSLQNLIQSLLSFDNFVYNIPTKLESDPSSKNNEWDSFANTSLKAIATKRLQFCLKRKTTAIKPMHTQEFEPRPTNSSISLSTSNVDNDLY